MKKTLQITIVVMVTMQIIAFVIEPSFARFDAVTGWFTAGILTHTLNKEI